MRSRPPVPSTLRMILAPVTTPGKPAKQEYVVTRRRSSGSSLKCLIVAPIPNATLATLCVASATAKGRSEKYQHGKLDQSGTTSRERRKEVGDQGHEEKNELIRPAHIFSCSPFAVYFAACRVAENDTRNKTGIMTQQ